MDSQNVSSFLQNRTTNFTSKLKLSADKEAELSAALTVTAIISFSGALGNLLVLLVTWPKTAARKSGLNLLIFQFVAANLFMCLVNIPTSVFMIQSQRDGLILPMGMCNYTQAFFTTGWTAVN
ncbi:hypothetical protein BV898_13026 [Hypsibius exemplaris]|uniref:G-protein coupled receptors family 1 profile domain-containing protein n=1 Tax=Hypsibius exemplaris TaxID=2072580 RepID=A0A1W0WBW1_HYPEX|nr:hypothetical protein BV898_13026 [Hypsibius exemplaris]